MVQDEQHGTGAVGGATHPTLEPRAGAEAGVRAGGNLYALGPRGALVGLDGKSHLSKARGGRAMWSVGAAAWTRSAAPPGHTLAQSGT
eukprot:scaffold3855_cov108-Isochrysis_galbana.AAC.5